MGYRHIPTQANFLMIDVRRPVRPVIDALSKSGVQVGRPFPTLPTHMRVTIGTKPQMAMFLAAFRDATH
jgi:histidinol-phosphate aminotransferase